MTSFVDDLPAGVRGPLLAGTGLVLAAGTLGLGRAGWPEWVSHAAALAIAVGLVAAWREARRRFPPAPAGPPAHERLRAVRLAPGAPEATVAAWNDRLAALDPAFSVPVLHRALRALAGDGAWGAPTVESVTFPEGEVVLTAVLPGRPDSVRLRVSRPRTVPLSRPDSVEHGWRLLQREAVPGLVPPALPAPDPGMPAARRALLLRDPGFDVDDFSSYLREIREELTAGEQVHLDPQGQADVAFWGAPPPAAGDLPVRWLEVELDGFYERIEVEHAGWWLSLLRPVGRADDAWRVWRVAPVGGAR
jgi:hypothetical protein